MKMITRLMVLASVPALAAQAQGQANQDVREILRATIAHVRSELPAGQLLLDPRVLSAKDGTSLAKAVGARMASEASTLVCIRSARDCRLIGGSALIVLQHLPTLSGDSAVVQILYHAATSSGRQPIHTREIRVNLARTKGVWHVIGARPTRMS